MRNQRHIPVRVACVWLASVALVAADDEVPVRDFPNWVADVESQLAQASAGKGAAIGTIIDWDRALPVLQDLKDRVRFTSKVRKVRWKDGVLSIDVPPLQPLGGPRGAVSGPIGRWIDVNATKDQARSIEVGDALVVDGVVTFQAKERRGDARPKNAQLLFNVGSRTQTVGWLVSTDYVVTVSGQELTGKDTPDDPAS